MRGARFNFASAGPLRSTNLGTIETIPTRQVEQVSALDLPGEQKFGLVFLMKSGAHSAANMICARLDEQGIPFPSAHPHWYDLRRFGYCALGEDRRHTLTPKGMGAAKAIIADLSIKFGIHKFSRSGGKGSGLLSRCSCGWRSSYARDSRGGQSQLNSAECWHIKLVESGKWPPRPVEEFLNEVMPPRFDFHGAGEHHNV